jgi:hypothetical protein
MKNWWRTLRVWAISVLLPLFETMSWQRLKSYWDQSSKNWTKTNTPYGRRSSSYSWWLYSWFTPTLVDAYTILSYHHRYCDWCSLLIIVSFMID